MESSLVEFVAGLRQRGAPRTAILGVGNSLNGDDAAGPLAAEMLMEEAGKNAVSGDQYRIFDAGPSPESFTGPLRRFAPELVVMIDAAELGQAPGTVRCFDWSAAQGMSASTHTLPPSLLAQFLVEELGCQVVLIGIQPKHLVLDGAVSPEVRTAVDQVVKGLVGFIKT
jgi:hydrogenase 3 maturation protease